MSADASLRLVPHAIEPLLPSADRLSHVIRARFGDAARVGVRYCVSPSGKLLSAALEQRSTLGAFDIAVMTDIVRWQFAAQPGPEWLRTCDRAMIVYRPRA